MSPVPAITGRAAPLAGPPLPTPRDASPPGHGLAGLTLLALGVVYGDIGTSPLYTVKEVFAPANGVTLNPANLLGAASCMFWALMLVVTIKYVLLILRADNRGEGGGLALTALAAACVGARPRLRAALLLLGMAGVALFFGDGVITPAISVLGAMEGLKVVAPDLEPYVVPAAVAVLVALFALQRHGTALVGGLFGPVIGLWFGVLAASGVWHIVQQSEILAALDPRHAVTFLAERGPARLAVIGALVLTVTGAEALYADLGHFGRRPVQLAWLGLVLPALTLNYMGQAALLMRDPAALDNPFFHLFAPSWRVAAVVLATLAAIIASQAVISGAYSATRQAIQMGLLPRMTVRQTSAHERGQIYLPLVNGLLLLGVLATVLAFRSTAAVAGAYGIAVTLTMLITTVLLGFVVLRIWHVPPWLAVPLIGSFVVLDATLVAACMVKFLDGGWFPLALGTGILLVMSTWTAGRRATLAAQQAAGVRLSDVIEMLARQPLPRAERTAVYLVSDPSTAPPALLHNLKHNQVLHACNVIATVHFEDRPWVGDGERLQVEALGPGFWRIGLHFGFMQTPDVPAALAGVGADGPRMDPAGTTYFLSRETLVGGTAGSLPRWRRRLFAALARNAANVADYFRLPAPAVVEMGTRVQV